MASTAHEDEEQLKIYSDGILMSGYGLSPRVVMGNPNISFSAKGLYAYLQSFAGSSGKAFPRLSTILAETGLSKKTYYKYRDELTNLGLVRVKTKQTRNGKFTVILLPTNPKKPQKNKNQSQDVQTQNPCSEPRGKNYTMAQNEPKKSDPRGKIYTMGKAENLHLANISKHNQNKNNNIYSYTTKDCTGSQEPENPNATVNNSEPATQSQSLLETALAQVDAGEIKQQVHQTQQKQAGSEPDGFCELERKAIKGCKGAAGRKAAILAYRKLLAQGYSKADIAEAYRRYTAWYRNRNAGNTQWCQSLNSWLEDAEGKHGFSSWLPDKNERAEMARFQDELDNTHMFAQVKKYFWRSGTENEAMLAYGLSKQAPDRLHQLARKVKTEFDAKKQAAQKRKERLPRLVELDAWQAMWQVCNTYNHAFSSWVYERKIKTVKEGA